MNTMQRQVARFHEATGITRPDAPTIRNPGLRLNLMLEELIEIADAVGYALLDDPDNNTKRFVTNTEYLEYYGENTEGAVYDTDPIAAIDGIADLLYVTFGTGEEWGIDIEPFFNEVHRSNMTKVGGPVRADGKRLKPDTYEPPKLEPIFRRQQALALHDALEVQEEAAS